MRLRSRRQYARMGSNSSKFTGCWIVAEIRLTEGPLPRLGITVTKRFGHAFERNRFRRLVREAFRLSCSHLTSSFDIVIRPRTQALRAKRQDIQEELLFFIGKATKPHGV